mmetsp:Transcript_118694/g.343309  ORF Transcript_118694/g.343309 Transcript_118694/m.343309 type:complete len:233 (+) Transcript_118694:118-816(+)
MAVSHRGMWTLRPWGRCGLGRPGYSPLHPTQPAILEARRPPPTTKRTGTGAAEGAGRIQYRIGCPGCAHSLDCGRGVQRTGRRCSPRHGCRSGGKVRTQGSRGVLVRFRMVPIEPVRRQRGCGARHRGREVGSPRREVFLLRREILQRVSAVLHLPPRCRLGGDGLPSLQERLPGGAAGVRVARGGRIGVRRLGDGDDPILPRRQRKCPRRSGVSLRLRPLTRHGRAAAVVR